MSATLDDSVLRTLIDVFPVRFDQWLGTVASDIRDDIIVSINYPGPSKPGDPPGYDTQTLMDTLDISRIQALVWAVFSPKDYAVYLELGTEKLAKRPFFTPVLEAWRQYKLQQSAEKANLLNV